MMDGKKEKFLNMKLNHIAQKNLNVKKQIKYFI